MFYDNLLSLCQQKNVKVTNVVAELNISSGNLSKWKAGVLPRADTLKKLSEYFNVGTDRLLGTEKINNPLPRLDSEQLRLFNDIKGLTPEQQLAVRAVVDSYKNK
jgi:transcriptional regulator with XRE-family HTH domain